MYFKLGLITEIFQLQSVVINSFICVYTCLPLNHFLSTTLIRDNIGGNLLSKMASFEGLQLVKKGDIASFSRLTTDYKQRR